MPSLFSDSSFCALQKLNTPSLKLLSMQNMKKIKALVWSALNMKLRLKNVVFIFLMKLNMITC